MASLPIWQSPTSSVSRLSMPRRHLRHPFREQVHWDDAKDEDAGSPPVPPGPARTKPSARRRCADIPVHRFSAQKLSPMRRPIVNKPLGIAYGTGELPAMIASSRDYHAYRSQGHVPGDLIPIANTNHFTILDELRQPNSTLTRAVIAMAEYQTA